MCLECEVSAVAKRKSSGGGDAPPARHTPQVVSSLPFHSSRETKHPIPSTISSSSNRSCGGKTASSTAVVTASVSGYPSAAPSSNTLAGIPAAHVNSNHNVWSPKPFEDAESFKFSGE